MAVNKRKNILKSKKGFASIEAIAMLFIMITLFSFTLGSFGTVHTGILSSISARAYMFEVMDQRADLNYHRSHPVGNDVKPFRGERGFRYVGISSELTQSTDEPFFRASGRSIDFRLKDDANNNESDQKHNELEELQPGKRTSKGVENVWVKIAYGICLNSACGGIQ